MKQYKLTFLLIVIIGMVGVEAFAHDFEVANADGVTVYYVKTSDTDVAVSYYKGNYLNGKYYTGSVIIPESVSYDGNTYSVTSIGEYAFDECNNLTSVSIPNSVTSIGDYAFRRCSGLTSVTIPDGVTSIGSSAFYNCSGLTSVTIGNSVTSIGSDAFKGCSGLTSIEIPNSVTSIGKSAFSGCTGLTSIVIPNSVTKIGDKAFYDTNLKSVTIGTRVLTIGSDSFYNSDGSHPVKVIWLTNTPPSGYTYASGRVNYVANELYKDLRNMTVYPFLSSLFEVNGVKYVPVSPSERTCDAIDCVYGGSAANVHIGKTVSYKGIEMTVKDVKSYTCYGNTSINNATISNQGNIGVSAFAGITGEFTATINNSGSIGDKAFKGSTGLTKLDVGDKVTGIGSGAFSGCSALKSAKLLNQGSIGTECFLSCAVMQTAEIGANIIGIGDYAFGGCKALQSVVIPDAVTSLGIYAFRNCSSMTSAKIGNGITAINKSTFSGCSALKDIQIGTGVKTIDTYSFSRCSSLPMIEIPKNVTDIKDYVFESCSQLKNVNIADREEVLNLGSNDSSPLFAYCPLEEVYIGGNISYSTGSNKGYSPFYRNTSLQTVTITDKETEISPNEFYGCTSLKNVSIGDGVTTIGDWAFSGCSSLENFSYGSMVNSIGQEAFSDCTAMTKLVSHAATPPVCGSQALDDINKWACTLSVPKGATASYQAADQWKEFFFINDELEIETLLGDANGDGLVNVTDIVEIVNDILGHPSAKFNKTAADVNNDGVVNVTDIVSVVNIILSDPVAARELLGDDEDE